MPKTIEDIRLEDSVTAELVSFLAETCPQLDMTEDDIQGIAEVKAIDIIKIIKKETDNMTRSQWEKIGNVNDWGLLR